MKYASSLLKLNIDERIRCLRKEALSRGIPVAEDETFRSSSEAYSRNRNGGGAFFGGDAAAMSDCESGYD